MSMSLGTLAIAANTNTSFDAPNQGVKAILIGNESGLTVTIAMESGGVQKTLYPGTVDWFDVRKGFTGNVKISPVAILNNVSTFPSSTLIFDAIGLNDSEQASMYPIALPSRNTNIGNTVSSSVTSTNSIDNEANPAATSIIKSIVSGDGANQAVSLTNDAVMVLGDTANKGSLTTAGPVTVGGTLTSTGDATFNGAGTSVECTNNLDVGGTATIDGATTLDSGGTSQITTDGNGQLNLANGILNGRGSNILNYTGTNTHVIVPGAGAVTLDVNGSTVVTVDSTGLSIATGINFNVGRIKDINNGTFAASGTINHGLSGAPAAVILCPDSGSSTWTVGASSYTSTQFTGTINSALTTRWLAYR